MGFIKVLAMLVAIPIFGFSVSSWVLSDIQTEITNSGTNYSLSQLCSPEIRSQNLNLESVCNETRYVLWLETGSITSAVMAFMLLLSFVIFASIAGNNRIKIARIFPPLVSVTLLVLAVLVILQGAILTYGVYLAESYAIQRVHFFLIGGLGLVALIGGIGLINSSFKLVKKQTHSVLGIKLDNNSHPKLFSLITAISNKLGSRKPEHVVVGLEPNFYVTCADVKLIGEDTILKGETLYLSLPLARILAPQEIVAIIGHELGHFRGADTYYSLKFAPVYSGLSHAISKMSDDKKDHGAASIATLPAFYVLSYIVDVFHNNISTISREREFEADKAATEVARPKALASSLLKLGLYSNAWYDLEDKLINRLQQGKITRNLSQLFSSIVKYNVNKESIPTVIDLISQQTITHPTDSHPPTVNRIAKLGINIDDINHESLLMPEKTCIRLFDDPVVMEEQLTIRQQQYYVALGVDVPEQDENTFGATVLAALGATMVVADGKIESQEIDEAETIGLSLDSNFDYIEFREYCLYPDNIPSMKTLLDASKDIPEQGKSLILDYLQRIAGSDENISVEEKQLLNQVSNSFGL